MRKKYVWSVLWLLYIAFVFHNSLAPAAESSAQSSYVLGMVLDVLDAVEMEGLGITEHIIRKTAHFAEYAVMGMLLCRVLGLYQLPGIVRRQYHALLGFLVPFVDETIQLFVQGRSGQISDVWLDCLGVAFGTVVFMCLRRLTVTRKHRRDKKIEK